MHHQNQNLIPYLDKKKIPSHIRIVSIIKASHTWVWCETLSGAHLRKMKISIPTLKKNFNLNKEMPNSFYEKFNSIL